MSLRIFLTMKAKLMGVHQNSRPPVEVVETKGSYALHLKRRVAQPGHPQRRPNLVATA